MAAAPDCPSANRHNIDPNQSRNFHPVVMLIWLEKLEKITSEMVVIDVKLSCYCPLSATRAYCQFGCKRV